MNGLDVGRPGGVAGRAGRPRRQGLWGDWVGTGAWSRSPPCSLPLSAPLAAPLHEPPAHFLPPPLRLRQHFLCKTGQPQALAGSALLARPDPPSPASHGGHQRPLHPRGRRDASALALSGLPSPQPLRLSSFNPLPGVDSFCAPLPPLFHHPLHGRREICPFQKLFAVPQPHLSYTAITL